MTDSVIQNFNTTHKSHASVRKDKKYLQQCDNALRHVLTVFFLSEYLSIMSTQMKGDKFEKIKQNEVTSVISYSWETMK